MMRWLILASCLPLTGCLVSISNEEFLIELGASSNHTRTVEQREIILPDGTRIIDEGIEEEAAENAGMSENAKDAWTLPFKVILPLAKGAAGVP